MPYSPVLIDSASDDTQGSLPLAVTAGWAQQEPAFLYQGNLYAALGRIRASSAFPLLNVFRSNDRGATWTALDAANAPVQGDGALTLGCYFDQAHTLTFCWSTGGQHGDGVLVLRDFSLLTQTWGAAYGAANSPTCRVCRQIFKRTDGTLIALINTSWTLPRGLTGLSAVVFSAGAWGAPFPVDTNVSAGRITLLSEAASLFDPDTQILHFFTRTTDSATLFHQYWFYQQVNLDGSLGPSFNFVEGTPNAFSNASGNPVLWNGNIVFGCTTGFGSAGRASVLVGTPIANPAFTMLPNPGIDPTAPFSNISPIPVLATDGVTLFALRTIYDNSGGPSGNDPLYLQLRLLQTTNPDPTLGWSEATIFDTRTGPPSFIFPNQLFDVLGLSVVSQQVFVVADAFIDNTSNYLTAFWFGIYVPPSPGYMFGGSTGARFKPCLNQGKEYLQMQMAEQVRVYREKCGAWPYRDLFPASTDLNVNLIGDLLAPAQDGNLHTVLQYRVPSGFKFILDGILQDAPTGFAPGDATWTVDENAQVSTSAQASRVQGLASVPVPLGSVNDGKVWRFRKPYEFAPLTVIRSKVMNTNIVPGSGAFVSGFFGFLIPLVRGE